MPRHRNRRRSRKYAIYGNLPLLKRLYKPRPTTSSAPIFLHKPYIDRTNETRGLINLVQQSVRILPASKGNKKPRSKISVMLPKIEEGDEEVEIIFDLSDLNLKLATGKRQQQVPFNGAVGGIGPEYVDVEKVREGREATLEIECAREGMDWEQTYPRMGIMIPRLSEQINVNYWDECVMQGEERDECGISVDRMDWEDEG